uniref:Uncharacterized protein n=1 Tax=Streptomyces sp. NBC_00003 TaxID=2903608 RepID=A0AAU2V1S8_9ACTN
MDLGAADHPGRAGRSAHARAGLDPAPPGTARARQRGPDFGRRGGPLLFLAPFFPPCVAWWIGSTCGTLLVRELPSEAGARKALRQT